MTAPPVDLRNVVGLPASRRLLEHGSQLFSLLLKSFRLRLQEVGLQIQSLLEAVSVNEFLRESESRVHIGFGVGKSFPADFLRPAWKHRLDGTDRLLRRSGERFESIARLLDALFGKISHFIGNLVVGLSYGIFLSVDIGHGLGTRGFRHFARQLLAQRPLAMHKLTSGRHELGI